MERSSGVSPARAVVPLALDSVAIIVFVAVGREEHESSGALGDVLTVAAPFLIGLGVGAALAWARQRDLRTVTAGGVILLATLVVGMLLRRLAWDRGTAATFVLVTTAFLAACLLGWRLIGRTIRR